MDTFKNIFRQTLSNLSNCIVPILLSISHEHYIIIDILNYSISKKSSRGSKPTNPNGMREAACNWFQSKNISPPPPRLSKS